MGNLPQKQCLTPRGQEYRKFRQRYHTKALSPVIQRLTIFDSLERMKSPPQQEVIDMGSTQVSSMFQDYQKIRTSLIENRLRIKKPIQRISRTKDQIRHESLMIGRFPPQQHRVLRVLDSSEGHPTLAKELLQKRQLEVSKLEAIVKAKRHR